MYPIAVVFNHFVAADRTTLDMFTAARVNSMTVIFMTVIFYLWRLFLYSMTVTFMTVIFYSMTVLFKQLKWSEQLEPSDKLLHACVPAKNAPMLSLCTQQCFHGKDQPSHTQKTSHYQYTFGTSQRDTNWSGDWRPLPYSMLRTGVWPCFGYPGDQKKQCLKRLPDLVRTWWFVLH